LGTLAAWSFAAQSRERAPSAAPARQLAAARGPASEDGIEVLFSPDGGCTDAVVREIRAARTSLDVQAFSFTSAPIAKAVADAHARGVRVRVVLDRSQATQKYSSATYLYNHNVPVWIDRAHAIAHNKVMVIDGRVLITGSFNFTKAAEENNAENLLILRNKPRLLSAYGANFEEHLGHSQRYTGLAR
jgi:phosphatidylserine/phosphatidylglycerophosphate/cardiolipin synthase-like enzyme